MSWSTGATLAQEIIQSAEEHLPNTPHEDLKVFFGELIHHFGEYDCDNLDECLGQSEAFDEAFKERYLQHWGTEYDLSHE